MTTIQNGSSEPLKLETIQAALDALFKQYESPGGEVSVLITDDQEMKKLNLAFRGIDEATDVLTFPAPQTVEGQVGDIAISISFARRQAESRGVPIHEEIAMLAIHGGLHLMGYDDTTDEERDDMIQRMNEVAASCGITTDKDWCSLPHGGDA